MGSLKRPYNPGSESLLELDVSSINDLATLRQKLKEAQAALLRLSENASVRVCSEQTPRTSTTETSETQNSNELMFSFETMAAMLKRENELRTCEETQKAYAEAELREDTDWMEITDALQRRVLREFGVPPAQETEALRHFRAGPYRYPELQPLAIYHRYQRSRQGNLHEGDRIPPGISLVDLSTREVDFSSLALDPSRPLVILAGSWS